MPDPITDPLHEPVPASANLPDDVETLKAMIVARDAHIAAMEILVKAFRQALFGRRSEKTDPDQFELALEDIETARRGQCACQAGRQIHTAQDQSRIAAQTSAAH